jgi:5-methylcytosine-specific restriction protein A
LHPRVFYTGGELKDLNLVETECHNCGKIPDESNWENFEYTEDGFTCRECRIKDEGPSECELCGREDVEITKHHLVPESQGGEDTADNIAFLCVSCHRKIHATFSNYELGYKYDSVEKLKEAPQIPTYIKWIENKDPEKVKFKQSDRKRYVQ